MGGEISLEGNRDSQPGEAGDRRPRPARQGGARLARAGSRVSGRVGQRRYSLVHAPVARRLAVGRTPSPRGYFVATSD